MLDVLDRMRDADARLAHPHARALRLQFATWLKAGALPATMQGRVARALGTPQ